MVGQDKPRKVRWDGPSACFSSPWHLLHAPSPVVRVTAEGTGSVPSAVTLTTCPLACGQGHCRGDGSCPGATTASTLGLMWEEGG